MAARSRNQNPNYDLTAPSTQRAIRLVEDFLMRHPEGVPAKDMLALGEKEGHSPRRMRIAKAVLNVETNKERDRVHGQWIWSLPPSHERIQLPNETPEPFRPFEAEPPAPSVHHAPVVPQFEPQSASDDTIREWARRKGYPLSRFGPIPQWAYEHFERDQAKEASTVRRVQYQSYCPECGNPSATLFRQVEYRETSDGLTYGVNDTGVQSVLCARCKSAKLSGKRANVEKRIASLEYQCEVLASADPNDPAIIGTQEHIKRLRRELADQEETMSAHVQ